MCVCVGTYGPHKEQVFGDEPGLRNFSLLTLTLNLSRRAIISFDYELRTVMLVALSDDEEDVECKISLSGKRTNNLDEFEVFGQCDAPGTSRMMTELPW